MMSQLIEVRQIDILTHPYYSAQDEPEIAQVPAYKELIGNWKQRAGELAQQSDSILLYFSPLIDNGILIGKKHPPNTFGKQELSRIKAYEQLLGNRFFLFNGLNPPVASYLKDRLGTIRYSPKDVKLFAYGEYKDQCVIAWGNAVQKILGIPEANYTPNVPTLTMDQARLGQVLDQSDSAPWWQKIFYKYRRSRDRFISLANYFELFIK